VTPAGIEEKIVNTIYFYDELLTIAVVTLANGFKVVGTSACASPENFNEVYGQKLAREDAVRQIWRLEGYLLRERLAADQQHS
jgi:hypothetical protein